MYQMPRMLLESTDECNTRYVDSGVGHLNFSASEAGKSGTGAYAFMETLPSFTGLASTGQTYVGYKGQRFDLRLGKLDSLTYEWVGSLNEADFKYANNIAVNLA